MGLLENFLGGRRGFFWFIFVLVGGTLVGSSYLVITFIWNQVQPEDEIIVDDALSAIYVDYYANQDDYISPESYIAMGEYQQQFPEPQNVVVLTDLDTTGVIGYMINHISVGMGVNCTHCHTLENFAADEWDDPVAMANKVNARHHLNMTRDLNVNWLAELDTLTDAKQPSGAQITCAVCHNGQAQPQLWSDDVFATPDDFRLPLEELVSVTEEDILNVNARRDISLDAVQYNGYVMYHMNTSLNVGCTHCPNSRYFPSWEVPAKYYALNMLQMTQDIWSSYGDTFGGQEPSCNMCHQGAVIPPGAARSIDVMPGSLVTAPGS